MSLFLQVFSGSLQNYNFLRHIAVKKVLTYSKQGHTQSQYFSHVAEHYKGYGKMKEKIPQRGYSCEIVG